MHPCRTGAPGCGGQRLLLNGRKVHSMLWKQCKTLQKSNFNINISENYFIIQISGKLWSKASSPFSMRKCGNFALPPSFGSWELPDNTL